MSGLRRRSHHRHRSHPCSCCPGLLILSTRAITLRVRDPTLDFEVYRQGAVQEILLIAQLLAFESGDGFQSWVDSRPPEELCELYLTGMIDDTMLPGGRATDPCQGVDDPSRYIPK